MDLRPRILLPRLALAGFVVLLATATITFAAETRRAPAPAPVATPAQPTTLLVPDVRRQAYVFAKTTLEEAGFAWRVTGGVAGYSANLVASQSPAPGTRVLDTGAPSVLLTLTRGRYAQEGTPENASPYAGTEIRLPGVKPKPAAKPRPKVAPKAKPKPKVAPKPKPKPKAKPVTPVTPTKPAKPASKRPPAFTVPGAKSEPLDEMPLPDRARALDAWLTTHQKPTDANVTYWLYQHAWIVTGAKLGWWRGEEALELLLETDARVQKIWGVGARSEGVARAALAEVRRKSR